MFVREKKRPQHTDDAMCIAVQVVNSEREGPTVRQRVLHHVGVARDAAQLQSLRDMGEAIKAVLERNLTGQLFASPAVAAAAPPPRHRVELAKLRHERSVVTGVHEVFGPSYHALGLDTVLPRTRFRVSHQVLFDTVMGRLGQPLSKRATAAYVASELGAPLALHAIYRMMDQLDDARIERLQRQVEAASRTLHPEPVQVVFFDCTTLYFEAVREDLPPSDDAPTADAPLRTFGYSKDGKANRVQVMLALAVTANGLPLRYELHAGDTYEGHTLKAFVAKLRAQYPGIDQVVVADAGMLSQDNLDAMDDDDFEYVTGARLKSLNKPLTAALHRHDWATTPTAEWALDDARRLVVWHSEPRAKRDRYLRERTIEKLRARLAKSSNPKTWLAKQRGAGHLLRVDGAARIELNDDGIAALARWDGLTGVVTNTTLSPDELRAQYHGLWQIERGFRITKHDLKVRPMFHWTPRRIRAHVAICYMAFACLRFVEQRLRDMAMPLSPARILKAATTIQEHIVWEQGDDRRYAMPAQLPDDAQTLLKALKIKRSLKTRLLP